ncbi:MAG: thioredoxin domain-containing protein [Spirochaetes bacterium]|nr:thioredoxin domain-containing protein [Spirochaetota bacterium]
MSLYDTISNAIPCRQCEDIAKGILFLASQNMQRAEITKIILSRQEERYSRIDFTEGFVSYGFTPGISPTFGSVNGRVKAVLFLSYTCAYCSVMYNTVKELALKYKNEISLTIKHMASTTNDPYARAALAAQARGKYADMADLLFTTNTATKDIYGFAQKIDIDMETFKKDMESSNIIAQLASDIDDSTRVYVTGTPALFINGKRFRGSAQMASNLITQQIGIKP